MSFDGIRRPSLDDLAAFGPTPVPFFPVRRFTEIAINGSVLTFLIRIPTFLVNTEQDFVRCRYFFLEQCSDDFEHSSALRDSMFTSVHRSFPFDKVSLLTFRFSRSTDPDATNPRTYNPRSEEPVYGKNHSQLDPLRNYSATSLTFDAFGLRTKWSFPRAADQRQPCFLASATQRPCSGKVLAEFVMLESASI